MMAISWARTLGQSYFVGRGYNPTMTTKLCGWVEGAITTGNQGF
jgi:hypothetical protein